MIRGGEMMFIDLAAIAKSPILSRFTSEEIIHIWDLYIRTYLGTDDEAFIKKAEHQIAALAYARRLFVVTAMPGLLTPEEFAAMKEKLFGLYDSGFEPLCF